METQHLHTRVCDAAQRLNSGGRSIRYGSIALLIVCAMGLGGVAAVHVCTGSDSDMEANRLYTQADSMPRIGHGTLCIRLYGDERAYVRVNHWAAPAEPKAQGSDVLAGWIRDTEAWCAERYRIIDRAYFATSDGQMAVFYYEGEYWAGTITCHAEGLDEGGIRCSVVIMGCTQSSE